MPPAEPSPEPPDVRAAADYVAATLLPVADGADWDTTRAGDLSWPCRQAMTHSIDAVNWYAALLARAADGDLEAAEVMRDATPAYYLDCLRSAGAVLAAVVAGAPATARGYHSLGEADPSGYAAMGADEVLVHGWDIARGLGVDFSPAGQICTAVLQRLFPWAPADEVADRPFETLLWANGRAPLRDRPVLALWGWWCRPLDEWDGETLPTWEGPRPVADVLGGRAGR